MKIPLTQFIHLKPFKPHSTKSKKLLSLINKASADLINKKDRYYDETIDRCDWSYRKENSRPWSLFIKEDLCNHFSESAGEFGYNAFTLYDLWFQQYQRLNRHGWHVHGCTYTGVYYLELPKKAPYTELIDPFHNNKIIVKVKEGDLIIFPSGVIHQAPTVKANIQKTIVSFNLDPVLVASDTLERIERL